MFVRTNEKPTTVLLQLNREAQAPFLASHLMDFPSALAARRWRASATRKFSGFQGLVLAQALPFIGSRESGGFGGLVPALRRQVLLTAWQRMADFEDFIEHPLIESLADRSWWAVFEIASTRGSHYGATPLAPGDPDPGGQFAALTLGRTRLRSCPRFIREGMRLGPFIRGANGLVTAFSAGVPTTGNCTVSLWQSEEDMIRFAYSDAAGHGQTVLRRPPILAEQLNARMRLHGLGGDLAKVTLQRARLQGLAAAGNS